MEFIEYTQHLDALTSTKEVTLVTDVRTIANGTLCEYQYVKEDGVIIVSILDSDTLFDAVRRAGKALPQMVKFLKMRK